MQGMYQVRIAKVDVSPQDLAQRLYGPLPEGAIVHIVPRIAGAGDGPGGLQVVLGAALMAFAWWNPAGWMGAAMVTGVMAAGAGMAAGGLAQMLSPQPKAPSLRQTDNGKQNVYFSSLANMVAQGHPLPLLYGEMQIGSRRISQQLSTGDVGAGQTVIRIGRGG